MKTFKCPLCGQKYTSKPAVYSHMTKIHQDEIPEGRSASEFYYNLVNKKINGSCVMCKRPTKWNENNEKYDRFCGRKECKDKYISEFRKRMIGKYGKVSLLNDPEQQKKMLANRRISGTYTFVNHPGSKPIGYTGSYELDFLKICDVVLNIEPTDIQSPSPYTFYYDYEGHKHFYIPDFYIYSLNLLIEIKDGGDNPNMHHKIQDVDKVKEKLKDDVMKSQNKFNYIKIVNKEYGEFIKLILLMRESDGNNNKRFIVIPQ